MDRESFEQLVSQWLDHPQDDKLRAAVEAAARSPELDRLKNDWVRLDQLVRGSAGGVDRVDWPRFLQRVILEFDANGTGLDERLRDATAVEQRVDWPLLRQRLSQAVDSLDERKRAIRFPRWRVAAGLALVGAAAVLMLVFSLPFKPSDTNLGVAWVHVSPATAATPSHDGEAGCARVTVSPLADVPEPDKTQSLHSGPAQPQLAEVFLMVEPMRVAGRPPGSLSPFGVN
jgi:hypothetical protein